MFKKKTGRPSYSEQTRDCRISLVVTQEMYDAIKAECYARHQTMNQYLNELIALRHSWESTCNTSIKSLTTSANFLKYVQEDINRIAFLLGMASMNLPPDNK